MSRPIPRGWCPGARRPMRSGDGLILRVRPRGGRLDAAQTFGLADLAERHGTGVVEATSRGNLQLRGVGDGDFEAVLSGLEALGLVEASPEEEARRNILLTPFAGAQVAEAEALAARLGDALADPAMPRPPSKFGVVLDSFTAQRHLAGVSGDIRIEAPAMGGGHVIRADGAESGRQVADAAEAVHLLKGIARWFVAAGGVGPDGRGRMRALLERGAVLPPELAGTARPAATAPHAVPGPCESGLCVAAAFGLFPAGALRVIAGAMSGVLRITPFRMLLLEGLDDPAPLTTHPDLILRPDDPMLRVSGCTGAPGCARAEAETRSLARRLAPLLSGGQGLHVSGCAKGCAHPGPAALTLVGREGRFDLVEEGRAWDPPARCGLAPKTIAELLGGP